MKVLVTGANGFLGSWLTRKLVGQGHQVRILCRPTSDLSELAGLDLEISHGDVTDVASVERASDGIDSVFHLAGLIAYVKSERARMEKINVDGTANVLQACEKKNIRRLIHMSSVVAVGASLDGQKILNEDSPFNLHKWNFGYSETKLAAEKLVVKAVQEKRVDAVILNPSTVYGAGDAKKGSRKTQLKVARGKFPFYTPGGVSIIAVEDLVAATLRAWEAGRTGERYILSGENITIKSLFQLIAKHGRVAPPKIFMPKIVLQTLGTFGDAMERSGKKVSFNSESAVMSFMYHWYDSAKARRELGLQITPADECIGRSVNWMREEGLLNK